MKLTAALCSLTIFLFGACSTKPKASTDLSYKNPIIEKYLADPCILVENGIYYLFATGGAEDERYIPIHRSKDLKNWEFVRGAVARGDSTDWNYKHFWAPEVYKIKDKFYLYYTASPKYSPRNSGNHVGLAVADQIEGPYHDMGRVVKHASIDGHLFEDRDGSRYFFYTIEHLNEDGLKAGQIYMDKMVDLSTLEGKPKQILSHHSWQEGPCLQLHNNRYYLTYSCGNWKNETYHLRYAVADSPEGPYVEQADTLLASNALVKGPGHHAMFKDQNNLEWIVYHGWDTAFTARFPRIDRIYFENGKLFTNGPSYTEQSSVLTNQ